MQQLATHHRAADRAALGPGPLSLIEQLSVRLGPVIVATRRATRTPTNAAVAAAADAVAELVQSQPCRIPDDWLEVGPLGYRRFELWRDPDLDCQILAMVWPAGSRTPIHDHGGAFGIEAVWAGELAVADYRLMESTRTAVRLEINQTRRFVAGQLLSLMPPADIHLCRNPSHRTTAVSLHVYGKTLTRQTVFDLLDDDWYELRSRELPVEVA